MFTEVAAKGVKNEAAVVTAKAVRLLIGGFILLARFPKKNHVATFPPQGGGKLKTGPTPIFSKVLQVSSKPWFSYCTRWASSFSQFSSTP